MTCVAISRVRTLDSCVIEPMSFEWLKTIIIKLSWAITIHKSQELTLQKAWIYIGPRERTAGMTYVAISRVRTLNSCLIEPMSFERLKTIKNASSFQLRMHLAKNKSAFVVWQIIQH